MAECLLRMEHITKKFGVFTANRDISLTLHQGEVLTLLGENGAGKSTLMNVLCGLYHPTEGKIFLHGQEVRLTSPASAVQRGIGMVHQHFMLVEAMTVFQNIILGLSQERSVLIHAGKLRPDPGAFGKIRPGGLSGSEDHGALRRCAAAGGNPQGSLARRGDPDSG